MKIESRPTEILFTVEISEMEARKMISYVYHKHDNLLCDTGEHPLDDMVREMAKKLGLSFTNYNTCNSLSYPNNVV